MILAIAVAVMVGAAVAAVVWIVGEWLENIGNLSR